MKKNILIIEDEENIARAEELILQEHFNVHLSHDGEDGLAKAQSLKPDLVILDLMLPKINGTDVCRLLRASNFAGKIVMVTAKNQDKDELEGMNIGADDYIMKPFEPDELKHVINQVLHD